MRQVDTRVCETCGKRFVTGYGYSVAAAWLVTGHSKVGQFMCEQTDGGQHWGCSPEHAMQALATCLNHDEHMSASALRKKHAEAESNGRQVVAESDKWMLDTYPNFPFVE